MTTTGLLHAHSTLYNRVIPLIVLMDGLPYVVEQTEHGRTHMPYTLSSLHQG